MGSGFAEKNLMLWRCAIGLVFVLTVWANGVSAACQRNTISLRGDWGQARFNIEVAETEEEKRKGLMFRDELPMSSGMLFVYDSPQPLSFWMRNTLIALDMLFIDSHGVVKAIHHRAKPLDETPIAGGIGVAVLEINGGLAEMMQISVGSEVQHDFFTKGNPVWPC